MPYHERLGYGQDKTGNGLGFYHAFSAARVGVSKRPNPYVYQDLKVQYDRGAGILRYYVDNQLVETVTTIGIPTPDMVKMVDLRGNTTNPVDPQGFLCGFGCLTLLDFSNPLDRKSNEGLVKLVNTPDFYVHPTSFVDPTSKASSRLWNGLGFLANHAEFSIDISPSPSPSKKSGKGGVPKGNRARMMKGNGPRK